MTTSDFEDLSTKNLGQKDLTSKKKELSSLIESHSNTITE